MELANPGSRGNRTLKQRYHVLCINLDIVKPVVLVFFSCTYRNCLYSNVVVSSTREVEGTGRRVNDVVMAVCVVVASLVASTNLSYIEPV